MDWYYIALVVPAMLLALWAQYRVSSAFSKYSACPMSRGQTGAEVARMILDDNGLYNVSVEHVAGNLTDHFDPKVNVVRLSDSVYGAATVAAAGVAAHECGHAVQYSVGYSPMKLRAAIIPITNIGSSLGLPMAVVGLISGIGILTTIGIVLFLAVVLFQLVTLPVEFNASSRAMKTLESRAVLDPTELAGARKVLTAAALTYVAALISAIANLLRLVLLRNRNRR